MRGPIVAGTDGSDTSRLALIEAGSLARQSGLDVVVVFVRQVRNGSASVFAVGAVRAIQDTLDSEQALAYAESVAILDPLKICWCFEVRTGQPAGELMSAAKAHGAETILVAGRRHGAIRLSHPPRSQRNSFIDGPILCSSFTRLRKIERRRVLTPCRPSSSNRTDPADYAFWSESNTNPIPRARWHRMSIQLSILLIESEGQCQTVWMGATS
jgi:nucleotide-binding universal stress UspA family protein